MGVQQLSICFSLQEECEILIDAIIGCDVEVITTLSDSGVDMNAIIYEVGYLICLYVYKQGNNKNVCHN